MSRLLLPVVFSALTVAGGLIQSGCHPAGRPYGDTAARPTGAAASSSPPAPLLTAASDLPTAEQAFRLVRFRTRIKPAEYGYPWRPEKIVPIRGGLALLMSWAEDTCHGCKPTLGVAYFHRSDKGWALTDVWEDVYQDGWNGQFAKLDMLDAGLPNPAVAVHGGWFGEGCDVDGLGLVELAPEGPTVRVVRAPLDSDNGGDTHDPARRMHIRATIIPLKDQPGLKIRYRGFLGRHRHVDTTVTYTGPGIPWTPQPQVFTGDCAEYWRDSR